MPRAERPARQVRVTLSLPAAVVAGLDAAARADARSRSQMAARLLTQALTRRPVPPLTARP